MTAAMTADTELADENKQNINLYSVVKEEVECFGNVYEENTRSFIDIKVEPFESDAAIKSNDKRISDSYNINCHVLSTYLEDEQQTSEFQVKEKSEKMSDAFFELDEHEEQNKKLYPVKLENESFQNSCENNTNIFINAKDELFEATTTDIITKNTKFIEKQNLLNIHKSKELLKYQWTSGEESSNKHKLKDLKSRDNHFYITHTDKNGEKLLDDEQSVQKDVSETITLKKTNNILSSEKIGINQIQSHFKDNMFDLLKSTHLRTHTRDTPLICEACHKSFSSSSALKRHLGTHTGEKPFNCEVCFKSFSQRSHMKKHLRTHTGEKPFNCEVCHKSFSRSDDLKRHLRTHTGEKSFNCEVCYKSFSQSGHLKIHLRNHTGKKHFNCKMTADMEMADENKQNINLYAGFKEEDEVLDDGCEVNSSLINIKDEPFESTGTVIDRNTNKKQISGTCNIYRHIVSTYLDDAQQIPKLQVKEESEKMSDAVTEINEHEEQNKNLYTVKLEDDCIENSCENNTNNFINANDEIFEATTTDIYNNNSEFIKNKTSNIREKNGSSCEQSYNRHKVCRTNFEDLEMSNIELHILHPDKNGDKLFVDEVALHEQSVRKDVSETLILKESKNMFANKKIETDESCLNGNMLNLVKSTDLRTHTREKPFNCDVCYKSFSLNGNLKSHLRTHTGEMPFSCQVCHKSFSRSGHLKTHLRTHTGEQPFNCGICHRSFSLSSNLKRHLRTHTGEKPFNCEVCYKSFSDISNLKSHLRYHKGEKPFNCEMCHKSFSQNARLKSHLRIHTGEKPAKPSQL